MMHDFQRLDAYVKKKAEKWQVPGLSHVMAHDGEVVNQSFLGF